MKDRVAEEYAKKFKLAQGAKKGAKKWKVLTRLVLEEQKDVFNMDYLYREKLFGESNKKRRWRTKTKATRKTSLTTIPLFWRQNELGSCLERRLPIQLKVKNQKKKIKNNNQTYLETIAEEEVQAILAVAKAKKVLENSEEVVGNQIIYTPESAADALNVAVQNFPITEAQLEFLTVPANPNVWEVTT